MELPVRLCLTLLGIFLSVGLLQYECGKLEEFPVYSTQFCPRNQTEWNRRSSVINCTKDNGYLCLPNKNLTQLIELCYTNPFIWVEAGKCLYFVKPYPSVDSYDCSKFQSGCHNASIPSYKLFEHPSCSAIGNGCFIAEPYCESTDTTTQPPETTKSIHVEIVSRNANKTLEKNGFAIDDKMTMIPILYGVLISISFFCMVCIIYRKENEEEEEEEGSISLKNNQRDKTGSIAKESPFDQALFEQWQEDNNKFVSTRACKKVEELIDSQNLVVVTGNSGSGKSAIIQHIALSYRSQGWTVKPVKKAIDIINVFRKIDFKPANTMFVLNDPIGTDSFDDIAYNSWKENEKELDACLKKVKLLVSIRKYILSDQRITGLLENRSNNVDLSNEFQLNNEEKQDIWKRYSSTDNLSTEELNVIAQAKEYFPLLCTLYFNENNKQKLGLQFFKEPVEELKKDIKLFKNNYKFKDNYCALVLLILFNGKLCVEDLGNNDLSQKKFKLALNLCEMKPYTATSTIKNTLKNLEGFLVKKIGDEYHFYHDFVMEVTTFVFGTDYPRETIQYADIGILGRRVKLENDNDENNQFDICLGEKYVSDVGERLFTEIFGKRMVEVVLNPCMTNEKVAAFFIQKLTDSPDKLNELLEKRKHHKKYRNQAVNWATEQSFCSKFDLLFDEDEVSILSAIIVFCHTNLSQYCLEALKKTQTSMRGKHLFSAVCCNGSIDLFNVFPKEEIKWFMYEGWGPFDSIHIASLFHNHEILRELIRVNNQVNLVSPTKFGFKKYGFTPIMLAALNMDGSKQNNRESKIQSTYLTMDLLLNHGAEFNSCHPIFGSPLHIASAEGNDSIVEYLLSKGAEITSFCNELKRTPLHNASFGGHESTVQLLLHKGAGINLCDKNKQTPLHIASEWGHDNTVKLLLDKGADINSCDKNKETPLHKAIKNNYDSTVKLLLSYGADVNSYDKRGETPLHKACENGHNSIVQLLLRNGTDIYSFERAETPGIKAVKMGYANTDQLLLSKGTNFNYFCAESLLHNACRKGRDSTMQFLLKQGGDVNVCDKYGKTPLHEASEKGHKTTVHLLLRYGADINSYDRFKETSLHKACENGHYSIVQLLLNNEADVNSCNQFKETPLHSACKNGHKSIVQLLLSKGANVNSCDDDNETPLHKACENGHESIVQLLLCNEAEVNSYFMNGKTPLHKAIKNGHKRNVEFLLSKGAKVNPGYDDEEPPLHIAIENGHESIVQLLLSKGADVKSCDMYGKTPLHKASKKGFVSIVKLLLSKGANVNSCDVDKETPLHKASENGNEGIVKLLLSKGANVNVCNRDDETALHKASENGHKSIVQLLLSEEANVNSCNVDGKTPLHKAIQNEHKGIVQLLRSNGAGTIHVFNTEKHIFRKPMEKDMKELYNLY